MPKAALLFNGIKLPFAVVDRAFAWATQSEGSLVAIFLRAKKDTGEGYGFPSDLDAAEDLSSTREAQTGHAILIDSNIRMLIHRATTAHIEVRTALLTDPSEKTLLDELGGCECIFASTTITETGTLTLDSINLKKWLPDAPVAVELIPE